AALPTPMVAMLSPKFFVSRLAWVMAKSICPRTGLISEAMAPPKIRRDCVVVFRSRPKLSKDPCASYFARTTASTTLRSPAMSALAREKLMIVGRQCERQELGARRHLLHAIAELTEARFRHVDDRERRSRILLLLVVSVPNEDPKGFERSHPDRRRLDGDRRDRMPQLLELVGETG